MASDIERGRRSRKLEVATLLVTMVVLALFATAMPAIMESRDNTIQSRRTDDLAACRSTLSVRAQLLTFVVADLKDEQSDAILDGLAALRRGDDAALDRIIKNTGALVEHPASDTTRGRMNAAKARLRKALDDYEDGVKLSGSDPAEFLRRCER